MNDVYGGSSDVTHSPPLEWPIRQPTNMYLNLFLFPFCAFYQKTTRGGRRLRWVSEMDCTEGQRVKQASRNQVYLEQSTTFLILIYHYRPFGQNTEFRNVIYGPTLPNCVQEWTLEIAKYESAGGVARPQPRRPIRHTCETPYPKHLYHSLLEFRTTGKLAGLI
jgi:hypothetical protein